MNIYEKLSNIQQELKAPKNQYNSFGGYKYRSCEDILEAVKPLLKKYSCILRLYDELVSIGNRNYVKATAELTGLLIDRNDNVIKEKIENTAYAREEESKKGMDGSQITGASSSYARKYALNGLFLIDDVKDSDTTNTGNSEEKTIKLASKKQTDYIKTLGLDLVAMCEYYGINDITELTIEQASEIIRKKTKKQEEIDSNGWMKMQE